MSYENFPKQKLPKLNLNLQKNIVKEEPNQVDSSGLSGEIHNQNKLE